MVLFHFLSVLLISVTFFLVSSPGTAILSGKVLWIYPFHTVACVHCPSAPWALPSPEAGCSWKYLGWTGLESFAFIQFPFLCQKWDSKEILSGSPPWTGQWHTVTGMAERGQGTRAWKWANFLRGPMSPWMSLFWVSTALSWSHQNLLFPGNDPRRSPQTTQTGYIQTQAWPANLF